MQKITKNAIRKGLAQGYISIEEDLYGCIGACCKIGDCAFYMTGLDVMRKSEYLDTHTGEQTVETLYNTLKTKEQAQAYGIYEDEWEYYRAVLS